MACEPVLQAFARVRQELPDCLLLLAPRHPQRAQSVMELARRQGFQTLRHSANGDYGRDTQVYLVDTLGELTGFYAAADVSFVGGSLVPVGGHNLLEPAALGVPVICGPHLYNFSESAEMLRAAGALTLVSTAEQLAGTVSRLLTDANQRHGMGEAGRRVVRENQGCLQRVLDALQGLWP